MSNLFGLVAIAIVALAVSQTSSFASSSGPGRWLGSILPRSGDAIVCKSDEALSLFVNLSRISRRGGPPSEYKPIYHHVSGEIKKNSSGKDYVEVNTSSIEFDENGNQVKFNDEFNLVGDCAGESLQKLESNNQIKNFGTPLGTGGNRPEGPANWVQSAAKGFPDSFFCKNGRDGGEEIFYLFRGHTGNSPGKPNTSVYVSKNSYGYGNDFLIFDNKLSSTLPEKLNGKDHYCSSFLSKRDFFGQGTTQSFVPGSVPRNWSGAGTSSDWPKNVPDALFCQNGADPVGHVFLLVKVQGERLEYFSHARPDDSLTLYRTGNTYGVGWASRDCAQFAGTGKLHDLFQGGRAHFFFPD